MEVFFKILHFLCLSSASFSFQLTPSLNVKTPMDFELQIGAINTNLLNNIKKETHKQCFCLPQNANGRPVINHLGSRNEDLKRIVVYLYKSDGIIKVYIPNKHKQELIPDLNFDDNGGDILKPVSSESIGELFDLAIIKPQQTIVSLSEDSVNESEMLDIESSIPPRANVNSHNDIENNDHLSLNPSDDYNLLENENFFDNENEVIDLNEDQGEVINNLELNKITNLHDVDQMHQSSSLVPLESQKIDSHIISVNNQESDSILNFDESDQLHLITKKFPLKQESLEDFDELHQIVSVLPSQSHEVVAKQLDEVTKDDSNQVRRIITVLPSKSQTYMKSPFYQNQYHFNPHSYQHIHPSIHSVPSKVKNYVTFDDWFENQLSRVVLYNLETPSKIIDLRERVKRVLQNNGMHISIKGFVFDSNGNFVYMSNIKLRPVLIGTQEDSHNFLQHQTNLVETTVAYVQLIEIILVYPPKLLGTLVMGTVYLPKNVNLEKLNLWNNHLNENIIRTRPPQLVGCISCKSKYPQNHYSYSVVKGIHYPHITVPYGVYYGIPIRRNLNDDQQTLEDEISSKEESIASSQTEKRIDEDVERTGFGGVLDGFLGNLGITPNLFDNPSRRLLGGMVPNGPKPGAKAYPNDVLPGFRIIGGNAATSSGTPLVSKGRSGLEKPSIINEKV